MTSNLAGRFAAAARRLPDKVAVFDDAGAHTYADLLSAAQVMAERVRRGTRREHVGLVAPTSAAFAVGYFGIALADKVAVPLNFLLRAKTLAFVVEDAGVDAIVAAPPFDALVAPLAARTLSLADAGPPSPPAPAAMPHGADADAAERLRRGGDDVATILYTSGTTGVPKGVLLSHRNFLRNVDSSIAHIHIVEDDVFLGILPFFHSFGITTSLLIPLLTGCSAVYLPKFTPQRVFEAVATHGVTLCFAVASMFRALMRAGGPPGGETGYLKFAVAGGEAVGAELARKFTALFGVPLLEGYGLTETSPVVSVNLPDRNRPGSAGPMLDWVEARTVDGAGRPLAAGEEGELWLRGESIAAGYHNRPDETRSAFTDDGWFRTGDLARIDADGYLWITGRKKELIISAGENISPNEIEQVLHRHPAVFEAAVLGVPDGVRGEVAKAFVTCREGAAVAAEELAAFCRQHLPRYKVPASFAFRAALPHGPTGKVHKLALRRAEGLA